MLEEKAFQAQINQLTFKEIVIGGLWLLVAAWKMTPDQSRGVLKEN